jgi:DNA-binding LytR/AlgR family response regulator
MPTAIIVDDEPLLRAQLRDTLTEVWPALHIVGEAGNGEDAVAQVDDLRPDFAFLDIEMPIKNGLEAAAAVKGRTHVVFITAYNQFALQAFERGAIDYVLKPVSTGRLQETVDRLKARSGAPTQDLDALINELRASLAQSSAPRFAEWFQATVGTKTHMIQAADILFIQSDTKYTRIVTSDLDALVRTPIKELLAQLDPARFWQVHRATIVNVSAIDRVERDDAGHQTIHLKGHRETLEVSRTYGHLFRQAL